MKFACSTVWETTHSKNGNCKYWETTEPDNKVTGFKHPQVMKLAFIRYQRCKKDLEFPHYVPVKLLLNQKIIWKKCMTKKGKKIKWKLARGNEEELEEIRSNYTSNIKPSQFWRSTCSTTTPMWQKLYSTQQLSIHAERGKQNISEPVWLFSSITGVWEVCAKVQVSTGQVEYILNGTRHQCLSNNNQQCSRHPENSSTCLR